MGQTPEYAAGCYFLIRPGDREANGLIREELQQLLKVLVILVRPSLRIVLKVVALLEATPRRKSLKKGSNTDLKDILPIELLGIDMEIVSTSIQILSQLLRNLKARNLKDSLCLARLLVGSVIERLARCLIHQERHVNKEIKTHLCCLPQLSSCPSIFAGTSRRPRFVAYHSPRNHKGSS